MVIFLGDEGRVVQQIHQAAFRQDIGGKKQLGVVCDTAETLMKDRRGMAESHDEQRKLPVGFTVIVHQLFPLPQVCSSICGKRPCRASLTNTGMWTSSLS